MEEVVVQTGSVTIGLLIIGAVGLLYLGRVLAQSSQSQEVQPDDTPTTLATRGAFLNVVIGNRRVGPIFGWAGGRYTVQEKVGSVEGKDFAGGLFGGGGSSDITQTVYYESGWHQLCLGPASRLFGIYESGRNILPEPLSSTNTASGSEIDTEVGTFRIYWGEVDQPVDPDLSASLGVDSAWPYVCYIYWVNKRLGQSATWPVLEYDVRGLSCNTNDDVEGTFEPYINDGTADGVNPAAALMMLYTADWPHGGGLDPSLIDVTTLNDAGTIFESESLGMNILISDKNNLLDRWIQAILLDSGAMLVDHPDGKLLTRQIRDPGPTANLPVVDGAYQTQPEVEIELIPFDDVGQIDRAIYTFKDRDLNYRDNTIEFGDDGIAEINRRYRIEDVRIDTVTQISVARTVANRRVPEVIGDLANIKYSVVRGASLLLPSQVFVDQDGRVMRVLSRKANTVTPGATLDCALDTYGLPALTDTDDTDPTTPSVPAAADESFTFFELPASVSGDLRIGVVVFRGRANTGQTAARVFASINGGANNTLIGAQSASAASFVLTTALNSSTGDIVADGPTMQASNDDANTVLDLSSQTSEWQNGRQLMAVEDSSGNMEIIFLNRLDLEAETEWVADTLYNVNDIRVPTSANATGLRYKATAVAGDQRSDPTTEPTWPTTVGETVVDDQVTWTAERFEYTAKNLIRGRYETDNQTFPIGSKVWVIEASSLVAFFDDTLFEPGETVGIRTQPFTASSQVDIGLVTPVEKQLTGDAVDVDGFPFLITGDGDLLISGIGDRLLVKE
jgi:hypothetical protein